MGSTGYRLKEVRLQHGLKQSEVAEVLHVSQAAYNRYEVGARDIPVEAVIELARFYGCTTDELLGSWAWEQAR